MKRLLAYLLFAGATLPGMSCIDNDLPYPTVEVAINNVQGEGFTLAGVDATTRTVTLALDEATDIRNVHIEEVTYSVTPHNTNIDRQIFLDNIRPSREVTGTFDLRTPLYVTLTLYEDYDWQIVASQTIPLSFQVEGQIGQICVLPAVGQHSVALGPIHRVPGKLGAGDVQPGGGGQPGPLEGVGGGLGGTDNFVKVVADWQGFYSFNPQNTIHLRARLGGVFENTGSRIPVFERFYVGGMDTVRGYSYTDASPRSQDPRYEHDVIGGDRMGVLNLEYVWTFQKDMGLALVPFFDIGFNYSSDDGQRLALDFDDYWVYSAGLELRWRSPMGDLRIAYGIPLKKDLDGEREPGRLEFSMGQFF